MTRVSIDVVQASLDRTIKKLEALPPTIARRALRTGVFKVGTETLKQAKNASPVGRTGQFRRSLAKKDVRVAAKGIYMSIVGQNRKKVATARQVAAANRRTGRLSKGLSGQGKAPPIHWQEKGTKSHAIRPRSGRRRVYWNIIKGGRMVPIRAAKAVVHTGHSGTGFLAQTEARYRRMRIRMIQREILVELRRMGVRL